MITITKTTERGPVSFSFNGTYWTTTERELTRVDDWRETPLGRINFGCVYVGPTRIVRLTDKDNRP